MIYLLSGEGREALRTVASRRILYAFDFDGTLTKLSPHRREVKLLAETREWLRDLATRAPCAIVSGRALSDLMPRVNGTVPFLIGNHGMEHPLVSDAALTQAEQICAGWIGQVEGRLAGPMKDIGCQVENKRYTLTVHSVGGGDLAMVETVIMALCQQLTPRPRLISGKASVNVLPPGNLTKGDAIHALMMHLRCNGLLFIGDDETDEEVFRLKEGLVMGVRVGFHHESEARYYVKSQNEVEEVLRFLVHRIDGTPEAAGSK
jgi:trehalose 6-phosphate phosphatase